MYQKVAMAMENTICQTTSKPNGINGTHRILILGWPVTPIQSWLADYPNVVAARIYKENLPRRQKRLKDLSFHLPVFLQFVDSVTPSYWYGDWKERITSFDTVILIDEIRGSDVFEYILKNNPSCNLCVFFDTLIASGSAKDPSRYKHLPIRFVTCDRKVAKQYGLPFMPYFYIFSPYDFNEYSRLTHVTEKQDVFFVGEEKGDRGEKLAEIAAVLDKVGLTYEFHLVPKNRHRGLFRRRKKNSYMPYPEVIERIRNSRAVLEMSSGGQTNLTQRVYEAMFFGKKLITTSAEVRCYDFYSPENIFILGERRLEELPSFLCSSFQPIPENVLGEYTFDGWIKRFLSE